MSVTRSQNTSRPSNEHSTTSTYIDTLCLSGEAPMIRRSLKLGFLKLPPVTSPSVQLFIAAVICLLCPGMFNALNGLGGAGLVAPGPANESNIALYACFSIVGFFAGFIVNMAGPKSSLFVGGISYVVYAGSFLAYKHIENRGFLIFGGAFLGACAGPFWAAQGAMLISYPSDEQKGRYTAWFWAIFNSGAAIGSLITLCQELQMRASNVASDNTYITIVALMFAGTALSLCLCQPNNVKREDGSHIHITIAVGKDWRDEVKHFCKLLRKDYFIVLLFPMFLTSNWCYPYQFNTFNLRTFNIRTRALNNFLYWLAEILGALVVGHTLDNDRLSRSSRAKGLVTGLALLTFGVWTGGYMWQQGYHHGADRVAEGNKLDFEGSDYLAPMFLYLAYGIFNATWQNCVYWILGKFTSDTQTASIYIGFYKGIQSAGGAISYRINNSNLSAINELLICWILLAVSLVIAAPVIIRKIRDEAEGGDTADEEVATGAGPAEISGEKVSIVEGLEKRIERKPSGKNLETSQG
ncbi:hypothetical protein DSL72_004279 [Monilinia vaccinii-corymbosi]|uniref:Major facilitator superfamily (MFS) profile domain-containing protein n=1 Tax=Monilinia vaccinii-corymbosi TaxID=61207 RepID=A0A8A3NYW2_9HELO|nr:hypothetical protein DSL72_004279 [Monilinia vaccinii-corymbosi]